MAEDFLLFALSGLQWVGQEGVGNKKLPVVYFLQLLKFPEASKAEPSEAFNIHTIALHPWPLQVQDHPIRSKAFGPFPDSPSPYQ